ncbi:MAG: M28 family peptidase [Phycisphaerales bacterium]|nr:M28 family peptidase [Phycisphaerales bacterium]
MPSAPGKCALAALLLVVASAEVRAADESLDAQTASARLQTTPTASSLSAWHDLLASEPHIAGTAGDTREIERLRAGFAQMGLEVEVHPFWALLPQPQSALVEIVASGDAETPQAANQSGAAPGAPPEAPTGSRRRGVISLPIDEPNLAIDPSTAHPDLKWGWNAFSASGDVTGEVVYANYGTQSDFADLRRWGIDCRNKIVIARYGGNFRGFKVKFAEEAGAAALIIYTDPADSGIAKGKVWPEGGWASDRCIQRGSLLTLTYPGDPLTPGITATKDAKRLGLDEVGLPQIPVQPIGYAAAGEILARMSGCEVPKPEWRGGLALPYCLEGGPKLRVRVAVEQDREIRQSANVLARIRGSNPQDNGMVIVGCHHDAWCFGAADPLAGTIVLMECAKSFAELAHSGWRPEHDIVFAAWGAEEYFLIGSTEWVEANEQELLDRCIAYVNLDMAAMGESFAPSATPCLRNAVIAAAKVAIAPVAALSDATADADSQGAATATASKSVYDRWVQPDTVPKIGDMGGGSDHAAFICRVGVPSVGLSTHGAQGTSYHSNYDTVAWYRATVGPHYRGALLLTRVCNELLLGLAMMTGDPISPAADITVALELTRALALTPAAAPFAEQLSRLTEALENELVLAANRTWTWRQSRSATRAWLDPRGIPGRRWNRNLFISSDPVSGYGAQSLPMLRQAVDSGDSAAVKEAVDALIDAIGRVQ